LFSWSPEKRGAKEAIRRRIGNRGEATWLQLTSCAVIVLGIGAASAGPCNTGSKDAGSGPTPGATGQSITTGSTETKAHPPTEAMNNLAGIRRHHRRILSASSKASLRLHSKSRVQSLRCRQPIKVAERM
jgi:hypothetical protein